MDELPNLPAGDFSAWLRHMRRALSEESATDVDCTGCDACCSSSLFVHIGPGETGTLARIEKELLAAAPGMPPGHVVVGYDAQGRCPKLVDGGCAIYEHRPLTCRVYDCRVFAAAGLEAGGADRARIAERARRWEFDYPSRLDRDEHEAVRAAARFISEHAEHFPGGAVPTEPSQLAILAIKVYGALLESGGRSLEPGGALSDAEVARAIVRASREFDAGIE